MTIEVGIAEDEIMRLTTDLLEAVVADAYPAITREKIFFVDQAPDYIVPARPFISCKLGSQTSPRAAGDRRKWPSQEVWRFTVTTSGPGTYSIEIRGTTYEVVWPGGSIVDLRDALLLELAADPDSTSVAGPEDPQIITTANEQGQRLLPDNSAGIVRFRLSTDFYSRTYLIVEVPLMIFCWGLMDLDAPDPRQSGAAIAGVVAAGFNHAELTVALRERGHVPARVSNISDGTFVENQQAQSMGGVQVVLATNSRLDAQIASTTQVPWTNASPQAQP